MHKNTTVGSLVGSSIGAAGGIAALAGLALAPFTLGASLVVTGVGAAVGAAGGVTGGASNITNTIKQKNLRETIEKIVNDFLNTINPMFELLNKIGAITENIKLLKETLKQHEFQKAAKGAADILRIASVAQIGKMCAEAAKEIRMYVRTVRALRVPAQAARATASSLRTTAAFTGALSALFLALDVYSIFQDSTELSEMNQPADERKAEEIKSETLKFILQMRETAAQFQKIVDRIKDAIDTFENI
ncbi:apolipoprotein L3-like isoform X1 [Megalobrama amblycephala]|uniref:apolipoprotein L3-like isoform X1 n=1 Tax=Megalobrama amblycephala TaxID=75352 RepID=UPI002014730F|nr:apolipoprotein L3-like isoform X1 [Megalobrama amblycephala]